MRPELGEQVQAVNVELLLQATPIKEGPVQSTLRQTLESLQLHY